MNMKLAQRLTGRLTGLDLFGQPIRVNYKGSTTFQTVLGGICTLLYAVMILINFYQLSVAFKDGSNDKHAFSTKVFNRYKSEAFNLSENGVELAATSLESFPKDMGEWVAW